MPGRFQHLITVESDTGCWRWVGATQSNGYGRVKIGGRKGKVEMAHRAVFAAVRGPIDPGLDIDHLCRNRACVNPDHLDAVPHRENVMRGSSPAIETHRSRVCRRGHPIEGWNRQVKTSGVVCRTCHNDAQRRRRSLARA